MDPAATTPQPPEPPRELISSERVRFLTSWKLWVPMLFAALLLIATAILWPAFRRMRALELIESRGGSYTLGEARWPWLASNLGRLGMGYYAVEQIEVHQPINLEQFGTLAALNDVTRVTVIADQVTPEWVETAKSFSRLETLTMAGKTRIDVVRQLIAELPTLNELRVGHIVVGDVLSAADITDGAGNLKRLYIDSCLPDITVEDFSALEYLWLDDMKDASLTARRLPALKEVYLVAVNRGTVFVHDEPLQRLSYGLPEAERLIIPSDVQSMYIQNIARCTITGGEDLASLSIYESSDLKIEGLPVLQTIELSTSFGGTYRLCDLPACRHLVISTRMQSFADPNVILDGVDNLQAVDAPWWNADDEQIEVLCLLPKLEHLVMSRADITPDIIPKLQEVDTLRFLRFPRRIYNYGDVDFAQLRRNFPQPGIRIHGPARSHEEIDRWTPP